MADQSQASSGLWDDRMAVNVRSLHQRLEASSQANNLLRFGQPGIIKPFGRPWLKKEYQYTEVENGELNMCSELYITWR